MNAYELEKVTLDAGCAERSCACYSPQFGDTDGVAYYPETVVRQQANRIAELEKAIKDADEASNSAEGVGLVYWFQLLMEEESTSCKLIKDLLK